MKKLFISFSGGRTSGYMLWKIHTQMRDQFDEIIAVFANTGEEREETLEFVDRFTKILGIPVVWVELVVNPESGKGTTHKVVTFETATRGPANFEAMCEKYGLPGPKFPHCTRELKTRPMYSYLDSIGWKRGTYKIAIGIRADEIDRMDDRYEEKNIWYPLVQLGITKKDVRYHWSAMPFDLDLKEHEGNCKWCWKKSLRKHLTLIKERPQDFETPRLLEEKYGTAGSVKRRSKLNGGVSRMFRSNRSVDDLFALAEKPFDHYADELDVTNGCTESCEIQIEEVEQKK